MNTAEAKRLIREASACLEASENPMAKTKPKQMVKHAITFLDQARDVLRGKHRRV